MKRFIGMLISVGAMAVFLGGMTGCPKTSAPAIKDAKNPKAGKDEPVEKPGEKKAEDKKAEDKKAEEKKAEEKKTDAKKGS